MMKEKNNNQDSEDQNLGSAETKSSKFHSVALSRDEEQLRYWQRDLFYKKLTLFISSGGFFLIALSLFANYWQLSINTKQLRLNDAQSEKVAKSIRAGVENSIVTHVTNLDQLFVQKPELMPYFIGNKAIDDNDPKYQDVSAAAFMVLDVFDLVATQNRHYPEFWDTPGAWDEWMIDDFSTSPILRATFDKYAHWYGKSIGELRQKGQERLEREAGQKAKQ